MNIPRQVNIKWSQHYVLINSSISSKSEKWKSIRMHTILQIRSSASNSIILNRNRLLFASNFLAKARNPKEKKIAKYSALASPAKHKPAKEQTLLLIGPTAGSKSEVLFDGTAQTDRNVNRGIRSGPPPSFSFSQDPRFPKGLPFAAPRGNWPERKKN